MIVDNVTSQIKDILNTVCNSNTSTVRLTVIWEKGCSPVITTEVVMGSDLKSKYLCSENVSK